MASSKFVPRDKRGGDAMTFKLFISAIIKFALGIVLVGALLFLPAWTFEYFMPERFFNGYAHGELAIYRPDERCKAVENFKED